MRLSLNQLKFILLFLSTGCLMAALRDISPLTSGLELSSPPPLGAAFSTEEEAPGT